MHGTARRGVGTPQTEVVRGRRIRPPVSRRGISLIETLVALAIIAVAMTVLGQIISWAMHESAFSRRRAEATLLSQERMEDLLAHRADLAAWEAAAKKRFEFDRRPRDTASTSPASRIPSWHSFRWAWLIEDMKEHPGLKKIRDAAVTGCAAESRAPAESASCGRRWSCRRSSATAAAEPNRLEGVTQ